MRIIDIYLAVTIVCVGIQLILTTRWIKYVNNMDEDKELKRIVTKDILKGTLEVMLKMCIPVYHIILFIGISVMILFDSTEKSLNSIGYLTYDNKLVKINNKDKQNNNS